MFRKSRRLLNRTITYIGNLSKQHIGISIVGLCLIGNLVFIGLLPLIVRSVW
jgi:hypothetical protein